MEDFKDHVKKGFQACKSDIEFLKTENTQLKDKSYLLTQENKNLKTQIQNLNSEISNLKAEIKGLSIAIDYIKQFSEKQAQTQTTQEPPKPTHMQYTEFGECVSVEEEYKAPEQSPLPASPPKPTPIKQKHMPSQDPYEALLAFKAKANKREILKQKMLSMIGETGMNLSELKFMFVEHFRYCSKATFYNYLKELEIEKTVTVQRENTKNYIYLNSMKREI